MLIMTHLCNFDEKKGIFSECVVENVHIFKKLNEFYVE